MLNYLSGNLQCTVNTSSLQFENQCNRLKAKLEYEQSQLEKQKMKLSEMHSSIQQEESNMAMKRKVSTDPLLLIFATLRLFCDYEQYKYILLD